MLLGRRAKIALHSLMGTIYLQVLLGIATLVKEFEFSILICHFLKKSNRIVTLKLFKDLSVMIRLYGYFETFTAFHYSDLWPYYFRSCLLLLTVK